MQLNALALGISLTFVALSGALPTDTRSPQAEDRALIDVSGAALFWQVVDGVSSGAFSPDSGRALLATHPGYRQIDRQGNRLSVIRHCLRLMVPGVARDTIQPPTSRFASLYPRVCDHLDSVRAHRPELEAYAAILATDTGEQARIAAALDSALALLPAAARSLERPTIYGIFFEPGGFGGATIALDLLYHLRNPDDQRIGFLAHELHHSMLSRLPADRAAAATASGSATHWWLGRIQAEGIASLLDKRGYVRLDQSGPVPAPGMTGFPLEHASRMARSPDILAAVDRAFVLRAQAANEEAEADSVFHAALEASIPEGGHALGQYMAMAIEQHGGRDAIIEATGSRYRFFELYQIAAHSTDSYAQPLSDAAARALLSFTRPDPAELP